MVKTKILGTGLNGLIGSQLTALLQDHYEFFNLSRSSGVDITNRKQVFSAVAQSDAPILFHLAAKADVDGCEQDKLRGENGEAWLINVAGTQHLADACQENGKVMIYISTDFVFDGRRDPEEEGYSELDAPRPINWYGYTKFQGEEIVRNAGIPYLVLRPAYPYGKLFEKKKDFVHAIAGKLQSGQEVKALSDHIFTPTYLPDIAAAIDRLISGNFINETIHIVGSQSLTPYAAAQMIAEKFGYDRTLIKPVTRAEYFLGKAERPYNSSLKNDRIRQLGVEMKRFVEGLSIVTL